MEDDDTIYAISSGKGRSAVAVIRVSGLRCTQILNVLCPDTVFLDRRATLTFLYDEGGARFDRALVIYFAAPRSFTGEAMIEFQVSGSRAVVSVLLRQLSSLPHTRPAEAGEFARRAYRNGKIDLVGVEGLAAIVEAETAAQLRYALQMADGGLTRECEAARSVLLKALAEIEALLDFSDVEDSASLSFENIRAEAVELSARLQAMLDNSRLTEKLREGMVVAIVGAPNVGKSTLFNRLAMRDLAIVSPSPGTTRDALEFSAEIAGFPVIFVDTAGLRETSDPIEAEGIARARKREATADFVLWLSDGRWNESVVARDPSSVQKVRTKADLSCETNDATDVIAVSAHTGIGISCLISKLTERAQEHFGPVGQMSFGTERQRAAARGAVSALNAISEHDAETLELVAEELRHAADAMGRITGRIGVEEILGEIFARLCVGK